MASVGIIANPVSGKDIRRLVARASVFGNSEKVNILQRVLLALEAVGVDAVSIMPDCYKLGLQALAGVRLPTLRASVLPIPVTSTDEDSTVAARRFREMGVGCILVLGGDGTNRVVAKGCGQVPVVSISTGTNNVFPAMVEGTIAGMAAGLVAMGLVDVESVTYRAKLLEVSVDGRLADVALIDVVTCSDLWVGARAIWDPAHIREVVLARAEPTSVGASSVGSCLRRLGARDGLGMYLAFGEGGAEVLAPIAPGLVSRVPVRSWRLLEVGDEVALTAAAATIALDGERELEVYEGQKIAVRLTNDGPRAVDIAQCMEVAARSGVFGRVGPLGRRV